MSLKTRFQNKKIVVMPGVYDGLTASLAEAAGFEALYLSGAAVAYTRLGRPDIGLTTPRHFPAWRCCEVLAGFCRLTK